MCYITPQNWLHPGWVNAWAMAWHVLTSGHSRRPVSLSMQIFFACNREHICRLVGLRVHPSLFSMCFPAQLRKGGRVPATLKRNLHMLTNQDFLNTLSRLIRRAALLARAVVQPAKGNTTRKVAGIEGTIYVYLGTCCESSRRVAGAPVSCTVAEARSPVLALASLSTSYGVDCNCFKAHTRAAAWSLQSR